MSRNSESSSAYSVIGGTRVDPLNMRVEDINIHHVAHSLARQCRYNGHTGGFLSVARHSLWVSAKLIPRGVEMEMWGLLHDATEAYIGDMIAPLKHTPEMKPFRDIEENLMKVVAEKFELPYPMPAEVHDADRFVTVDVEIGMRLRDTYALDCTGMSVCDRDQREFIAKYYDLTTRRGKK